MRTVFTLAFVLAGCGSVDPTEETDEDLSTSHIYACHVAHHSAEALHVRVSKTRAKVLDVDTNEFGADLTGQSFTWNASYVPHTQAFQGRAQYRHAEDNTVLVMEQTLRTGGTGYLTIEGGHIPRERADFICRR